MLDKLRLDGKVCVVTGGSSGIGKEIAKLFYSVGAKVIILGLEPNLLQEAWVEIGTGVEVHSLDVSKEEEVIKTFAAIEASVGKVDVLVNNAGIFAEGTVTTTTYETWQKIMQVNLDGAFLCSKYAIPLMQKNKYGRIINIASEAGITAIANQTVYNVSKAAMISMSQSMALDYIGENIRVNCVCPVRVVTALVQKIVDESPNPEERFVELGADRPYKSMGNPTDIAYAVLNFANDSMPYAVGAILSVDGGYTVQ